MLPIGLAQAVAAMEHGTWYARSAELLHSSHFGTLRWLRALGDTVFALGVVTLASFLVGLLTGGSYETDAAPRTVAVREESAANS
jgi:nitric oxide reductase subunit B